MNTLPYGTFFLSLLSFWKLQHFPTSIDAQHELFLFLHANLRGHLPGHLPLGPPCTFCDSPYHPNFPSQDYGSFGFILLGFNYLAYGFAHYFTSKVLASQGAKKSLAIGTFANFLYIASYLFPVGCGSASHGFCSKGFGGTLLFITSLIGGAGLAVALFLSCDFSVDIQGGQARIHQAIQ